MAKRQRDDESGVVRPVGATTSYSADDIIETNHTLSKDGTDACEGNPFLNPGINCCAVCAAVSDIAGDAAGESSLTKCGTCRRGRTLLLLLIVFDLVLEPLTLKVATTLAPTKCVAHTVCEHFNNQLFGPCLSALSLQSHIAARSTKHRMRLSTGGSAHCFIASTTQRHLWK